MAAIDNVSNYIKAYHISWNETPPHELKPDVMHTAVVGRNVHPDILHMGTRRSAIQIHRTHLHEYEIDPTKIDPLVYSDEDQIVKYTEQRPMNYKGRDFTNAMRGKQEGLWESTIPDVHDVVHRGIVTPYRNRGEDPGSISYMVPKSAIQSGAVRYKGFDDLTQIGESGKTRRREIEEEEKAY